MKHLIYMFLFGLFAFMSCSKEPTFPDPKLDTQKSVKDTVRRDTIDIYNFTMRVVAPNGVNQIQVLNGRNYTVLKTYTDEYSGKKDFDFVYSIDLTDITKDSTLYYTIKVIDNNLRSYNKSFSLYVREFSKPTINLAGAKDKIGLQSPYLPLDILFETGLNRIVNYRISFEGVTLAEKQFSDTIIHSLVYKNTHLLSIEKDIEYNLKVELTDDTGQSATKNIIVKLMDLVRPVTVVKTKYSYSKAVDKRFFSFDYNAQNPNQLDGIEGVFSTTIMGSDMRDSLISKSFAYKFTYTSFGKVESMSVTWEEDWYDPVLWVYTYDANHLVTRCEDGNDPSIYQLARSWYPNGQVESVQIGSSETNVFTWMYEENSQKELIFADYSLSSGSWNPSSRQYGQDLVPWYMPTYLESLPAIVPYFNSTAFLTEIRDLLLCKQGFAKIVTGNSAALKYNVNYYADAEGRLQRISFLNSYGTGYEYTFFYE